MKATGRLVASILALVVSLPFLVSSPASAQVSLTTLGTAHTQNFDTLPASGSTTWTNNSNIPGWFHARTGTGTTIVANNGSSNAGNLYSYGTGTATDRALGSVGSGNAAVGNLFWGIRLQNNTGSTITSLEVSYVGEQWRNSAAAAQTASFSYLVGSPTVTGTLAEFQSAGVAVAALDFTGPITGGAAGALDGNLAANRVAITTTIVGLTIPNGTEVMLRWSDPDHTGADHGLSIDDFSVTPNPSGGPVTPNLSINDAIVTEGDAGTVVAAFTVSLTAPAGAGGVTFDITTADNSATLADNDYLLNSLTGQTIAAGNNSYAFNVTVNGDTTPEPNETFFVNVTNVTGATIANVADGEGLGTINNDDVTISLIHDIQGPGASSPIPGASVTVRAIVTGVRSNGFFVQEEEADYDANPLTSEGILVFVGGAPPAAAAVGNLVQVTGTVFEFVPTQDPLQPPLTELTSPTTLLISSGNPLPAAIPLTTSFPDPAGVHDQLERLEGMRVSVTSLTVVGPTLGNINEANATATTQGVFYGVVTGNARPFREAGIQAPDPPPAGTIPPIPRFDSNPERIRVDSDNLVGSLAIDVGASAVVSNLVGPLDYTFRTYSINPDPASPPTVVGGSTATAVTAPLASEFTVAAYNLQRFFDTVNDPGIGDPVLTAAAFNNRLAKASLGIRDFLRTPDIVGVVEVENLSALQALAARISADAIAAAQPDPLYQAFLSEGNDVGGIDVGFLVKTALVSGATPRVTINSVTQFGLTDTITNPDTSTDILNDRPPLLLDAVVNHANGATFPVIVIVNHLRSLNGVADLAPGPNGWATGGDRVRNKRQKQAEFLANLVQSRQVGNPAEHIVLVGDFNAFEFNDGFGDSMGVIDGTPSPDNETAVPGDGIDLVNPDFTNLASTAPALDRYSFIFDGNAQSLDHVLVNTPLIADTLARREEHPRINADFPEVARNDNTSVVRLADHDPLVAFFRVLGFASADLSITKSGSPDPVTAGTNLTYTIGVTNAGPDAAANASWSDTLPAGTTFVSLSSVAGWSCTTPAVGAGGTVSCSNTSFAVGSAAFSLVVNVSASTAAGTVLSNTATVTATTTDPNSGNNSATAITTVGTAADLVITKTDSADPVLVGTSFDYILTLTNAGPSNAATVALSDPLPAGTTFTALASPGGWACTTPAVGSGGTVSCSIASFAPGTAVFTITVTVGTAVPGGTILANTATATSATPDPTPGNESDTEGTTVNSSAMLVAEKTVAGSFVPGEPVFYTVVISNVGPGTQPDNPGDEFVDVLPAGLTLVGATADIGVAATAGNTVTWNGALNPGQSATVIIEATLDLNAPPDTLIENQGTLSYDGDGNGTNESTGVTDDPATGGVGDPTSFVVGGIGLLEVPTLGEWGLALLMTMLALAGVAVLRRRG